MPLALGSECAGIVHVQWTVDMLRMKTGRWYFSGIGALPSLAFGVAIMPNLFVWTDFLWILAAISMIVNAVFDRRTVSFASLAQSEIRNEITNTRLKSNIRIHHLDMRIFFMIWLRYNKEITMAVEGNIGFYYNKRGNYSK